MRNSKYKNWQNYFGQEIKDLTIKIFYKFLLYIKPRYNSARKRLTKNPHQNFTCLKPAKKHVIWLDGSVKFFDVHHSNFSRRSRSGNCALFMVEFGQILPFSSNHSGLFFLISSEICWDIELIFVICLCYYIVVLKKKKPVKFLKSKNWVRPKMKLKFFWK